MLDQLSMSTPSRVHSLSVDNGSAASGVEMEDTAVTKLRRLASNPVCIPQWRSFVL